VTFDNAKLILAGCTRSELRDHAFGDREIYWTSPSGEPIASGYSSDDGQEVYIEETTFYSTEAVELFACGTLGTVERNDSAGPDEYKDGACMPGLTLGGVLREITEEEPVAIRERNWRFGKDTK
jgi:hypothetical protein